MVFVWKVKLHFWGLLFVALSLPLISVEAHGNVEAGGDGKVFIEEGFAFLGSEKEKLEKDLEGTRSKLSWYKDEIGQVKVSVKAFHIDRAEVTNEKFKVVFPDTVFPGNLLDHPAVNITWSKASEYCKAVGGHLPTEAQWIRAARGDSDSTYPWGDEFSPEKAVFMGSSGAGAMKVGSYEVEQSSATALGGTSRAMSKSGGKSRFGLYDMAGNAWEWIDGWYDESKGLRLLKGGSWLSPQSSLRVSSRLADKDGLLFNDYGFRCAYDQN